MIRQANGSNLPAMLASDSWNADTTYTGGPIRIGDVTLDGNGRSNSGTNVLVIRSWLTVIEDLQVENAPADGIQITNLSKNGVALTTTQVNGRISNCLVTNSGGTGIHIVDTGNSVTDWDLLDSWVAYSGQSAIYMDNAAGWKIRGNHVYGIQQHALYANACFATSIDTITSRISAARAETTPGTGLPARYRGELRRSSAATACLCWKKRRPRVATSTSGCRK